MSKVVVFDVDGTLFDTKLGIIKALNEVLLTFGLENINSTEEDKWIGPPVKDSFIKFMNMNYENAEKATKQYRKIYTEKFISESTLYEGMSEVINILKVNDCHLCIATMKTQEQIERLLSIKKMTDIFEVIETASTDGSKSKFDMLKYIKTMYPTEQHFYMIGDTQGDYEAAKNADYDFIYASYGYGKIDNLRIVSVSKCKEILHCLEY